MKESSNGILTAPSLSESAKKGRSGFVQVRGAREHNLKTWILKFHATRWWSLRGFPVPESLRWPSVLCMPRLSDDILNPSRRMQDVYFTRWRCPKWIPSRVYHQRWHSNNNAVRLPLDRRLVASPLSRTSSGCCTHAREIILRIKRFSMPNPSRRIRRKELARSAMAWGGSTR